MDNGSRVHAADSWLDAFGAAGPSGHKMGDDVSNAHAEIAFDKRPIYLNR